MSKFDEYLEAAKKKKKENWDLDGDGKVEKEEVVKKIKEKAAKKKKK